MSVLGEELVWAGPQQNPAVDDATFRHPVDVSPRLHAPPLDWRCRFILGGEKALVYFTLQACFDTPRKIYLMLR